MNANEYYLQQITQQIRYYEKENSSVIDYNKLKQKREQLLNDLSHNW
jgi:hypothetical protein